MRAAISLPDIASATRLERTDQALQQARQNRKAAETGCNPPHTGKQWAGLG